MTEAHSHHNRWTSGPWLVAYVAVASALLHFAFTGMYGIFRDELYYIACANRLAWGYVDHPPLSIAILAAQRALLGDSLFALRLTPVLATSAVILVTGGLARSLGAGRAGQFIAALSIAIAPFYLGIGSFYSMNAFEPLLWMSAVWVLIRWIQTGNDRLWILFGVIAGLALMNKLGTATFGVSLVIGLLLTKHRRAFLNPWLYAGGAVAFLILLPHLVWELANDWPFLEFARSKAGDIAISGPVEFLSNQLVLLHPLNVFVWGAGLVFLLRSESMRRYRILAIMFIAMTVLFILQGGKSYYLAPAYPMLIAAGAVAIEQLAQTRRWLAPAVAAILTVSGAILVPMGMPMLPPETYLAYEKAIGLNPPREEISHDAALPQHFSDRFGWTELADAVAAVYHGLPEEDRNQCAILGRNYGDAAAIDYFGSDRGLPDAISAHNTYWLWGPGDTTGEVVIAIGGSQDQLEQVFESVERAATLDAPFAEIDGRAIYLCRGLRTPITDLWPRIKGFG